MAYNCLIVTIELLRWLWPKPPSLIAMVLVLWSFHSLSLQWLQCFHYPHDSHIFFLFFFLFFYLAIYSFKHFLLIAFGKRVPSSCLSYTTPFRSIWYTLYGPNHHNFIFHVSFEICCPTLKSNIPPWIAVSSNVDHAMLSAFSFLLSIPIKLSLFVHRALINSTILWSRESCSCICSWIATRKFLAWNSYGSTTCRPYTSWNKAYLWGLLIVILSTQTS